MQKGKVYLYDLSEKDGWLLSRHHTGDHYSPVLQIRRSNFVEPWRDASSHFHTSAHEIFLVLKGELWLIVEDLPIRLQEESLLVVQPGVPHVAVGGRGPIQHYVMQISDDHDEKKTIEEFSPEKLKKLESSFQKGNPELDPLKGFFADLTEKENHNCWLIGYVLGNKYLTKDYCFAYMIYNDENAVKKTDHRDIRHYHSQATEWYWTFEGEQELEVAGENIRIPKDHLLRIGKKVPHNINWRTYPFRGLTMRTSISLDEKVEVDAKL
ncbi:MAG: cupin domain-containing protein [Promethearchaeota archaeon]